MEGGRFLIYISNKNDGQNSSGCIPVRGYMTQINDYWFGVYRATKDKLWRTTELSTGLAIADHKTMKDAKEFLNESKNIDLIDAVIKEYETSRINDLREKIKQAYLDPKYDDNEKLAKTYYKLYG